MLKTFTISLISATALTSAAFAAETTANVDVNTELNKTNQETIEAYQPVAKLKQARVNGDAEAAAEARMEMNEMQRAEAQREAREGALTEAADSVKAGMSDVAEATSNAAEAVSDQAEGIFTSLSAVDRIDGMETGERVKLSGTVRSLVADEEFVLIDDTGSVDVHLSNKDAKIKDGQRVTVLGTVNEEWMGGEELIDATILTSERSDVTTY